MAIQEHRDAAHDEQQDQEGRQEQHGLSTVQQRGQIEFDAAGYEKERHKEAKADRFHFVPQWLPRLASAGQPDDHPGGEGAWDEFKTEVLRQNDKRGQQQQGKTHGKLAA